MTEGGPWRNKRRASGRGFGVFRISGGDPGNEQEKVLPLKGGGGKKDGSVERFLELVKMGAALGSAMLLGHWFLAEVKRVKAAGQPFYRAYMTIPGVLVALAVLIPAFLWLFHR